jgi:hypothetical protein
MSVETEQRHLQMLLTVSSFGESLRRHAKTFGGGIFKAPGWKFISFPHAQVLKPQVKR